MSDQVVVSRGKLVAVADAIREKTETTEALTLDDMPVAIEGIQGGGGENLEVDILSRGISGVYSNNELKTLGKQAFAYCSGLTGIDFPNLEYADQFSLAYAGLKSVSLSVKTLAVSVFVQNFQLTTVDLPNLTAVTNTLFKSCERLETCNVPNATSVGTDSFYNCYQLQYLALPSVKSITGSSFRGAHRFKTLVLSNSVMCTASGDVFATCYHFTGTVHATYNPEGLKDGYVYVPSALIDSYKAATNWSKYADQIRAIEDYPEITGG